MLTVPEPDKPDRSWGDALELLENGSTLGSTDGCTLTADDCDLILRYIDRHFKTIDVLAEALVEIKDIAKKSMRRML
jgi:hypothetical protein